MREPPDGEHMTAWAIASLPLLDTDIWRWCCNCSFCMVYKKHCRIAFQEDRAHGMSG